MKIALDYDDTYTADPLLWDKFVMNAMMREHEVMVVTFRDPSIPIERMPAETIGGIHVYYTSYQQKRRYMKDQGVEIDVWIDDTPDAIV